MKVEMKAVAMADNLVLTMAAHLVEQMVAHLAGN